MAEVKLRLNLDSEEVELVVDNEVALTSGSDVFKSWVSAYNTKHPLPVPEPEIRYVEKPVEEKVVDVEEPVKEEPAETETVEVPVEEKTEDA